VPPDSPPPSLADVDPQGDPWNAALIARAATKRTPLHDGAWATLGLAHALLGNYAAAITAYTRAHRLAPQNPWYAHNLGHLLDVAMDRPADALPLLRAAERAQPGEPDLVSSLAHALARCGELEEAVRVLDSATRDQASAQHAALRRWIEAGAPAGEGLGYARGAGVVGHAKLDPTRPGSDG
jgi:Flp pilus assembly protein TadD